MGRLRFDAGARGILDPNNRALLSSGAMPSWGRLRSDRRGAGRCGAIHSTALAREPTRRSIDPAATLYQKKIKTTDSPAFDRWHGDVGAGGGSEKAQQGSGICGGAAHRGWALGSRGKSAGAVWFLMSFCLQRPPFERKNPPPPITQHHRHLGRGYVIGLRHTSSGGVITSRRG